MWAVWSKKRKGGFAMAGKYILVVDDDPDLVETVGMMLESRGFEVGRAYDGIEGEEAIKERKPDLIILDIMMPRKDGYVLCSELKANPETADIPVVLLTAVGEAVPTTTYSHADGMATEADDYIAKPIDTESLIEVVNALL
jgi:DNA-binding response OmpR family regulator